MILGLATKWNTPSSQLRTNSLLKRLCRFWALCYSYGAVGVPKLAKVVADFSHAEIPYTQYADCSTTGALGQRAFFDEYDSSPSISDRGGEVSVERTLSEELLLDWRRAMNEDQKSVESRLDQNLLKRAGAALERGRAERHPVALSVLYAFLKDEALGPQVRQAPVEVTNTAQDLAMVPWLVNGFSGSRRDIETWAVRIRRGQPEPTSAKVIERVNNAANKINGADVHVLRGVGEVGGRGATAEAIAKGNRPAFVMFEIRQRLGEDFGEVTSVIDTSALFKGVPPKVISLATDQLCAKYVQHGFWVLASRVKSQGP